MVRPPADELLHAINNLLGTIGLQVEAAAAAATHAACKEALRLIAESAARTHAAVQRFRALGDVKDRSAP